MLRFLTAGESHGIGLSAIIEGLPAGLNISVDAINSLLERRQKSYGRGTRMKKIEKDRITIVGGVRHGLTLGSPLALYMENKDWANRKDKKSPPRRVPRPGHADLAGTLKYQFDDIQNVIERASARETAIRTAVGAVAIQLLAEFGIEFAGRVVAIGTISSPDLDPHFSEMVGAVGSSPVYCADPEISKLMCTEIDRARQAGDTLGGTFEVRVLNVPPGLGSHVHWDRKLDGRLAQAILSIPSVKACEFGEAIQNARLPGSQVHDEIHAEQGTVFRTTNRAGGIEGGISNGEDIIVRGFAKPISSLKKPLRSVNLRSKEQTKAPYVRSDVCVVPAISVIAEAMVAWVVAECFVEKFGGDSLDEMKENYDQYMQQITG